MLRAKLLTLSASTVAVVGGLLLGPTEAAARAEQQECVYGDAALCTQELCSGPGIPPILTCQPCSLPWCEDNYTYSCCF